MILSGGEGDAPTFGLLSELLAESRAEIAGLFLEDADLFRLAELPFTREISRLTSHERPLTGVELERQVRVQALQAERILRHTAERAGLRWSFKKMRGRVATAIEAALDMDLLLLGAARRTMASTAGLHAPGRSRAPTKERRPPLAVVFDASDKAIQALSLAAALAESSARMLDVLLVAESPEAAAPLESQLDELLPEGHAALRRIPTRSPDILIEAFRHGAPALLVIATSESMLEKDQIGVLRRKLGCPTLLVR